LTVYHHVEGKNGFHGLPLLQSEQIGIGQVAETAADIDVSSEQNCIDDLFHEFGTLGQRQKIVEPFIVRTGCGIKQFMELQMLDDFRNC
jgi:hypothetical protein